MAEIRLQARLPLGGYDRKFSGTRLREATGLAIVSLAIPQGEEGCCEAVLRTAWGLGMPDCGRSVTDADEGLRILRTQPDQLFVLFECPTPDAREVVHAKTGGAFWSTDQTDAWCALELSGQRAREALARLCMLDLDRDVFGPGHAARTLIGHLGAIIVRTGDGSFLLLSSRSSAASFLETIETSIRSVS